MNTDRVRALVLGDLVDNMSSVSPSEADFLVDTSWALELIQAVNEPDPTPPYYTIQASDRGKRWIRAFGRTWAPVDFMGFIHQRDIGKHVYLVGDHLQVENDQQFADRLRRQGIL